LSIFHRTEHTEVTGVGPFKAKHAVAQNEVMMVNIEGWGGVVWGGGLVFLISQVYSPYSPLHIQCHLSGKIFRQGWLFAGIVLMMVLKRC
jgi:hypothetical protein